MDNTNTVPPFLGVTQPSYPHLMQSLRVTGGTVPGPSGYMSSSVLGPNLYIGFVQQLRTDTLLPRDREPCLVLDLNGYGLVPGYYEGRLSGQYKSLPVYAVQGQFLTFVPSAGSSALPSQSGGLTPAQVQALSTLTPAQFAALNNLTPCQLQVLLTTLPISQVQTLTNVLNATQLTNFINSTTTSQLLTIYNSLTTSQIINLTTALNQYQIYQLYQTFTGSQISSLLSTLTPGQLVALTSLTQGTPNQLTSIYSQLTQTQLANLSTALNLQQQGVLAQVLTGSQIGTLASNLTGSQLQALSKYTPATVSALVNGVSLSGLSSLLSKSSLPTAPIDTGFSQTASFTSGTQNNVVVYGTILLVATTGTTTITGMVPVDPSSFMVVTIINTGTGSLLITNESASSSVGNRFSTSTGITITIAPGSAVTFTYDPTTGAFYWTDTAASVAMGGGGGGGITALTGDVTASGSGSVVATIANGVVTEAMQDLSDVDTGNVSDTAHGYAPKNPNDATKYLDGTGNYSVPSGGGGSLTSGSASTSGAYICTNSFAEVTGVSLSLPASGTYLITATVEVQLVSSNAGDEIDIRLYDTTNSAAIGFSPVTACHLQYAPALGTATTVNTCTLVFLHTAAGAATVQLQAEYSTLSTPTTADVVAAQGTFVKIA